MTHQIIIFKIVSFCMCILNEVQRQYLKLQLQQEHKKETKKLFLQQHCGREPQTTGRKEFEISARFCICVYV